MIQSPDKDAPWVPTFKGLPGLARGADGLYQQAGLGAAGDLPRGAGGSCWGCTPLVAITTLKWAALSGGE